MKLKAEIHGLNENELEELPEDMKTFGPLRCVNCKNKKNGFRI